MSCSWGSVTLDDCSWKRLAAAARSISDPAKPGMKAVSFALFLRDCLVVFLIFAGGDCSCWSLYTGGSDNVVVSGTCCCCCVWSSMSGRKGGTMVAVSLCGNVISVEGCIPNRCCCCCCKGGCDDGCDDNGIDESGGNNDIFPSSSPSVLSSVSRLKLII